ncbi:MAG: glycosyltransferase family 4 protein [Thermoproteota archaeon]|nr:glycosyltransferase family 4 protein [Thermoproteota archaeon]
MVKYTDRVIITIILVLQKQKKQSKLLFFGYPSKSINYTGGFLWMKKVADYIEKSESHFVLKTYAQDTAKKIPHKIIGDIRNSKKAVSKCPDIAILDAWGEANIFLWILLRLFKPKTKIIVVFHHHEERIPSCKNVLESSYNFLIQKGTSAMIRNADTILTVSQSSKEELSKIYGIDALNDTIEKLGIEKNTIKTTKEIVKSLRNKIAIVGTGIDSVVFDQISKSRDISTLEKDIDYLCIGRIEKFYLLEKIWMAIKVVKPDANLVMVGRTSPEVAEKLRAMGIDHRGFVSEEEKIKLYQRAKVFVFPSSKEGFGIAVAEALYNGLAVVAWKLPVFEELYQTDKKVKIGIKLVDYGKHILFVDECLLALDLCNMEKRTDPNKKINLSLPNWQTVAQNVLNAIESVR